MIRSLIFTYLSQHISHQTAILLKYIQTNCLSLSAINPFSPFINEFKSSGIILSVTIPLETLSTSLKIWLHFIMSLAAKQRRLALSVFSYILWLSLPPSPVRRRRRFSKSPLSFLLSSLLFSYWPLARNYFLFHLIVVAFSGQRLRKTRKYLLKSTFYLNIYSNTLFTYLIFTEHPHFLLTLPVNVQQNIKG